jgi:ribosomal protein L31
MKEIFRNSKKTWIQLTDGSVISTKYLFEKSYNKLDIDIKAHRLWRFDSKNTSELSITDKRILKFNKRFAKKNNNS